MVNVTHTLKDVTAIFRDFIASQECSYKNGYLQQVRADIKLIGIVILIFLAITTSDIAFLLFLIVSAFSIAFLSRIHIKKYIARFYVLPIFSLIVVLPWVILKKGKTLYSFYGIAVTYEGVAYVGTFFVRVMACVAIVSLLLFTTKTPDLIFALRKMKVPSPFVDIFVIVYRYTFTFLKELYDMLLGKESRTIVRKKSVRNAKKFIGNFMRRVLAKNEDIYMAMKAKGFNGSFKVYKKKYEWGLYSISYIVFVSIMVFIWVMTRL